MKVLHPFILLLAILFIAAPVAALTESPPILKPYVNSTPAVDDHFFRQVSDYMTQLSGQTVSSGDDLWFFTLLASGYNIEEHKLAQEFINFLFYTAKAGQHYDQSQNLLLSRFIPVANSGDYGLAETYLTLAKKAFNSCEACQERYPDFEMYTLPEKQSGSLDMSPSDIMSSLANPLGEDVPGVIFTGQLGW